MLVLSRKIGEEIIIADRIRVKVVGIQGNRVKLGIVAPEDVTIHRQEIYQIRREFVEPSSNGTPAVAAS